MRDLDFTYDRRLQDYPDSPQGVTKLTDYLYIGGQEDVCQILGKVDLWIDFRGPSPFNRKIYIPEGVVYVRIPFNDGDETMIEKVLPKAKLLARNAIDNKEIVLISCHAGISRSVVLAWWLLTEEWGDHEKAWNHIKHLRAYAEPDERFHDFIQKYIVGHKKIANTERLKNASPGTRLKHYKGGTYRFMQIVRNANDFMDDLVIYQSEYDNSIWARPLSQFFDEVVDQHGNVSPRFEIIDKMSGNE